MSLFKLVQNVIGNMTVSRNSSYFQQALRFVPKFEKLQYQNTKILGDRKKSSMSVFT